MYSAPSVHYPVGNSRFAAHLALAVWLAGAASTGAWMLQTDKPGWRQALAAACVVVCAALAWRQASSAQRGTLSWTGQNWRWSSGAASGEGALAACLDVQYVMLLRFHATGAPPRWCTYTPPRWLWLERRSDPQRWDELRRAVYSRARVAKSAQPEPF